MKNILITNLMILGFLMNANAETTKVETKKTVEVQQTESTKKAPSHKRMSREERIKHNTQEVEALMASASDKAKSLTGVAKKLADLSLAHAKLEIDAAKDPELSSHAMPHLNYAKREIKKADKNISTGPKSITEKKEPAKEPAAAVKK